MRKWMRERLKRRKQKPQEEQAAGTSAQEPLRPAYFEAPPPAAPLAEERAQEEVMPAEDAREQEPEPVTANSQSESAAQGDSGPTSPRRRRRRGRGGRGRRPAKAQTPPTPLQPTLMPEAETAPQEGAPASVPAATKPQAPKGVVVLAIGLPGSGKSSWFKRHNISPLSSDVLRQLLFDDPAEQRYQDLVFSNLRSMLKARLIARRPTNYVDATNLTPHDRHTWIKMARDYGYDVHAVFFDVPTEVCVERNQRRRRVVPDDVMRRMAGKLRPPTFEEGFSKITVVRVKKKEAASNPQR
ncbi:MAG TPA: AAA family ATPase [Terriglobales bacterium]|nr:AAA family ATPase [Terriglobales bacterium]